MCTVSLVASVAQGLRRSSGLVLSIGRVLISHMSPSRSCHSLPSRTLSRTLSRTSLPNQNRMESGLCQPNTPVRCSVRPRPDQRLCPRIAKTMERKLPPTAVVFHCASIGSGYKRVAGC